MDGECNNFTLEAMAVADEEQLVLRARTNAQAFECLYEKYFSRVYGYVIKRVGNREVAEDIVSETFLKAFSKLGQYKARKGCSFAAWLYRIATNNIIDYYRRSSRSPTVDIETVAEPADPNGNQAALVEEAERRKIVHGILEKLPETDRKILYLKFFAELSNIEIAGAMNISANNAGVMVYRALRKFSECSSLELSL